MNLVAVLAVIMMKQKFQMLEICRGAMNLVENGLKIHTGFAAAGNGFESAFLTLPK